MRVLLDLDGVCADFNRAFSLWLNANYGTTLDPEREPTEYPFADWGGGMDQIDADVAVKQWVAQGGYAKMPPYPGFAEFYRALAAKADVYIVTARVGEFQNNMTDELTEQVKQDTVAWLKQYDVPTDKLFFTYQKVPFCLDNNIPVLIEDKLQTALKAAKEGLKTVLINRAWNASPARLNVYRASNYQEVLDLIDKLIP